MTAKYLLLLLDNKLAEFVSTCLTIVQGVVQVIIFIFASRSHKFFAAFFYLSYR